MSKIADKLIDIEEMLRKGYPAEVVARYLNVPLDWVWQVEDQLNGPTEDENEV